VTLEISGQSTVAYAATATSHGIVVAGQAIPNGNGTGQVLVAKYDSSGRLDADFGRQGIYRSSLPETDGPFVATAVARDAQGRLLVAGRYGLGSALVLRLTATRQLDTTFGTGGLTTIPVGSIAQSMAVQKDGRILVWASNLDEHGRPMVVVRLTSSGAIDHSFGTNGKTEILLWDANHASSGGVSGLAATAKGTGPFANAGGSLSGVFAVDRIYRCQVRTPPSTNGFSQFASLCAPSAKTPPAGPTEAPGRWQATG
jgi:uncharacterized delta-60 repeat protein